MSNRKKTGRDKGKKKAKQGLIECGYCNEPVEPNALRCPHCGKWYSSGKRVIAVTLAVIVTLSLVGAYVYYSGGLDPYTPSGDMPAVVSASPTGLAVPTESWISVTFNREMNRASVQSSFHITPETPGSFSWSGNVMTYIPTAPLSDGLKYSVTVGSQTVDTAGQPLISGTYEWSFTTALSPGAELRTIGTGAEQFWDRSITHPAWTLSAVYARPVLIFTHEESCGQCDIQAGINGNIFAEYMDYITYYNLTSGTDEPRAGASLEAYDPDALPHEMPLTVILTKGPDNSIIWHSWEGVIDEAAVSSWIEDAITYHEQY